MRNYNWSEVVTSYCDNCKSLTQSTIRSWHNHPLICAKCYKSQSSKKAWTQASREKRYETNLARYGGNMPAASKDVTAKRSASRKPNQTQINERIKQTKIERHGSATYNNSEKAKKTNLERYGYECTLSIPQKRYHYRGLSFDSSYELAFFIYLEDSGKNPQRPKSSFVYFFNDKKHRYYPDIYCEGVFYEIKGKQFLNEDGTWKDFNCEKGITEAKHQCAISNNVQIIYDGEKYFEYCATKFNDSRWHVKYRNC